MKSAPLVSINLHIPELDWEAAGSWLADTALARYARAQILRPASHHIRSLGLSLCSA